jgi:hypothetical protein
MSHPVHKHAAIRHMIHRMNSYKLTEDSKKTEYLIIEQVIANNWYKTEINFSNIV